MTNQSHNQTTTCGQPLLSTQFETPPIHIPDGHGGAFKTELVVLRTPGRTVKLLWWHADDPRPEPHNHPWKGFTPSADDAVLGERTKTWFGIQHPSSPIKVPWDDISFVSEILDGGYTETVYWIDGGVIANTERTYRAGDINVVLHNAYHVVHDVQPKTRTRVTCGTSTPGNEWGYLDAKTGEYVSARGPRMADNGFLEKLRAINPHMRPKAPATAG